MKKLSKGLYVGGYIAGSILSMVFVILSSIIGLAAETEGELSIAVTFIILGGCFGFIIMILIMVLTYKMWAVIQDGHARTTPIKAVGFLLIPIFNLYWIFQVLPGFAEDYNKYAERHSINVPKASVDTFQFYAIFILISAVLSFIPYFNIISMIAGFIFAIVIINHVVNALNALYEVT